MIEPDHSHLSVVRQCALVSIDRSTFCRAPSPETAENLLLMRLLDEQFLETPWLIEQDHRRVKLGIGPMLGFRLS